MDEQQKNPDQLSPLNRASQYNYNPLESGSSSSNATTPEHSTAAQAQPDKECSTAPQPGQPGQESSETGAATAACATLNPADIIKPDGHSFGSSDDELILNPCRPRDNSRSSNRSSTNTGFGGRVRAIFREVSDSVTHQIALFRNRSFRRSIPGPGGSRSRDAQAGQAVQEDLSSGSGSGGGSRSASESRMSRMYSRLRGLFTRSEPKLAQVASSPEVAANVGAQDPNSLDELLDEEKEKEPVFGKLEIVISPPSKSDSKSSSKSDSKSDSKKDRKDNA